MSENMNEPWSICGHVGLLIDRNGKNVIGSPEVQRRIAACVNACAGLQTDGLDAVGVGGLLSGIRVNEAREEALERERDQLLAALKFAVSEADAWGLADDECEWLCSARAAIAAVEAP